MFRGGLSYYYNEKAPNDGENKAFQRVGFDSLTLTAVYTAEILLHLITYLY